MVSTSSLKTLQKKKNALFKRSQHSFLSSRFLQNYFLRSSLWTDFDLSSFERLSSLSQKMVSTLSLKNLQRFEKCTLQRLRTFVFELQVASKPFSKKLPMAKFWFKAFWMLCLTFPENGFNFVTQKFVKNWKMPFSNAHNIRFWAQGFSKTIF